MPWLKQFWWVGLPAPGVIYLTKWDIPGTYEVLRSISVGCTWLGFAYGFPRIPVKHDISYGIYIYHMIVINVAIELGYVGSWTAALAVLVLTVLMAVLSCVTVAKFSQKKKLTL